MTDRLEIALGQFNPLVGEIAGNADKARAARKEAAGRGAHVLALTELFITGYPPEDLVMKGAFQQAARAAVEALAAETGDGGPALLIGTPWVENDRLYNSYALLDGGKVAAVRHKVDLPNYGVFDEKRLFAAGQMPGPVDLRGVRVGLPICEDIWGEEVCECLEETGAELLVVPNGSPFSIGKRDVRMNRAVARVTETGLPLAYVNQVGGQDELVFDGASFVLNADCTLAVQMPGWDRSVEIASWRRGPGGWRCEQGLRAPLDEGLETIWIACVLGLRDYVEKNGFRDVVIGLSGGIDSATCAALAVDALGAERVRCLMLPYKYTSQASLEDARACAEALGVGYETVAIGEPVEAFGAVLEPLFAGRAPDVTEENIQSRVRGTVLMAISNKFGPMLVTTGNKSEVSVGYATLYGDMAGGFNPIKDLYKTQVYALAGFRNQRRPAHCLGPEARVIPEHILTKAPSAELRPDQTDQDTLPPYEVLDDILQCLIDREMSVADTAARGHPRATVEKVEHMLYIAEYKRRQSAPGVRVSERNFGRDRRYPITNAYRDRA